jgi:porphobilinogen synthase
MSSFPLTRLRRLRSTDKFRRLVRETELSIDHFVYPLFISEEISSPAEISAMPGISQWSLNALAEEAARIYHLGIPAVLLFGIPKKKDAVGSQAYAQTGIVQKAIKIIKKAAPELIIITDVCLCEYTSHGHCGVIDDKGYVQNDASLPLLTRMALSHAQAGADMIAPSDMMDGRVGAIRNLLDENGFHELPLMSYSAKYASGFYGPFREAAQSAPQFGDRKSYQMDPANVREALLEIDQDIKEGADIIMVKPALAYLDVIYRVREEYDLPLAAYSVSGEYSMIKAAAQNGWIDEKRIAMEMLLGIKRAGADIIISYFAPQVAEWLKSDD